MPTYVCNLDKNTTNYNDILYDTAEISEASLGPTAVAQAADINSKYKVSYLWVNHGGQINKYPPYPDTYYSTQWHVRYDTSAIPANDTVTSTTLSLNISAVGNTPSPPLGSGRTPGIQMHGVNWTYTSSGTSGYPGTQSSNWKDRFTNNLCFKVEANVTGTITSTGTSSAITWINKGGWTYFVGLDQTFLSGGSDYIYGLITTPSHSMSRSGTSLTVITTAGSSPTSFSYNLIVSPI